MNFPVLPYCNGVRNLFKLPEDVISYVRCTLSSDLLQIRLFFGAASGSPSGQRWAGDPVRC